MVVFDIFSRLGMPIYFNMYKMYDYGHIPKGSP